MQSLKGGLYPTGNAYDATSRRSQFVRRDGRKSPVVESPEGKMSTTPSSVIPPAISLASDSLYPTGCRTCIRKRITIRDEPLYIIEYLNETIRGLPRLLAVCPANILDHVSERELERFETVLSRELALEEDNLRQEKEKLSRDLQVGYYEAYDRIYALKKWDDVNEELDVVASESMDITRYRAMIVILKRHLKRFEAARLASEARPAIVTQPKSISSHRPIDTTLAGNPTTTATNGKKRGRPRKYPIEPRLSPKPDGQVGSVQLQIPPQQQSGAHLSHWIDIVQHIATTQPKPVIQPKASLAHQNRIASPREQILAARSPTPMDEVEEEEYEVEEVLAHKVNKHKSYFLTKWAGYPEPTWEPFKNFAGNLEPVQMFFKRLGQPVPDL